MLQKLEGQVSRANEDRIGAELREDLRQIGARLARALEITSGNVRGGIRVRSGLSIVPGGLRVELGETKRLGVYFRSDDLLDIAPKRCHASIHSDAISVSDQQLILDPVEGQPGVFRAYCEVTGNVLTEDAVLEVHTGSGSVAETAAVKISVRLPIDGSVHLDQDLQFSQRRYTAVPGKRKRIEVFADPVFSGHEVTMSVDGSTVSISPASATLTLDEERGIASAAFIAEAPVRVTATLEARCTRLSAQAKIAFEPVSSGAHIEFRFIDRRDFGLGRRFQWDIQANDCVLIAAEHPTLERLLGRASGTETSEPWPGQRLPQTRALLAEVICEAYVARRLDGELASGSLTYGPDNLVDPVEYENFRYQCLEECLEICHEALTPAST